MSLCKVSLLPDPIHLLQYLHLISCILAIGSSIDFIAKRLRDSLAGHRTRVLFVSLLSWICASSLIPVNPFMVIGLEDFCS